METTTMTDLGINRLCAEAMGLHPQHLAGSLRLGVDRFGDWVDYDPLHDDAQTFQLLRRMNIEVHWLANGKVATRRPYGEFGYYPPEELNRAICECVARHMKEKADAAR